MYVLFATLNFFLHFGVVVWSGLFLSGLYLHDLGSIEIGLLPWGALVHAALLLPLAALTLRWGARRFEGREFAHG